MEKVLKCGKFYKTEMLTFARAAAGRGGVAFGGCFEKMDSENFLPVANDMLPFTYSAAASKLNTFFLLSNLPKLFLKG